MRMSWKLGKIAGIDFYLHSTFLLLIAYVMMKGAGPLGVALTLAAFGCVLLHELGHALMARRFGIETLDITLYPIGGVARLEKMPRSPGAEMLIALAGPAVNLAIVAGLMVYLRVDSSGPGLIRGTLILNLLWVNLILALFNMIPAFPMDGGRVLRALLSTPLGRVKATLIAAGLGRGLAVLFGFYSLIHGHGPQVFLALFIYLAAGAELANVIAEERRRRFDEGHEFGAGNSTAPPGFCWVQRGQGAWQLIPIILSPNEGSSPEWR
ncbi:MAG: hypothetical protein NVSMB9_15830 [Isosphaeraceae bacterium]